MIIDASVAFKWFVFEEGSDTALSLLESSELNAPVLIASEVANAFRMKAAAEQLDPAITFADELARLPRLLAIVDETSLAGRALEIARELQHPVYDCIYLAMAEQRGELLVTADMKFLRKLEGTNYAAKCIPLERMV